MKKLLLALLVACLGVGSISCEASLEETLLVGGTEIPYHKLGMNMFPRNRTAGSLLSQMNDIRALGITSIRVNFWFDTFYMPTATSMPDFAKFDEVVTAASLAGIEIVGILAYIPDWLQGSGSWKTTFINSYVIPVVSRYSGQVRYWEVWNEPDTDLLRFNLDGTADDYFDLLRQTSIAIKTIDSSIKVVAASTESIVIDGLDNFNWTQRLIDLGLTTYADVLNIHYYSELDIELSVFGGPLVQSVNIPNWVTETGNKGQSGQKDYFETAMPYIEKSVAPERIYWYCYIEGAIESETVSSGETYGLVTYAGGVRSESSLYTHLKSR